MERLTGHDIKLGFVFDDRLSNTKLFGLFNEW